MNGIGRTELNANFLWKARDEHNFNEGNIDGNSIITKVAKERGEFK